MAPTNPSPDRRYLALRLSCLLGGLAVCVTVLSRSWRTLPWQEVILLGLVTALVRLRIVVMRRDERGTPTLFHMPGTALVVFALLHAGPSALLAVNLLSLLIAGPLTWGRLDYMRRQAIGDPFFFSALNWGMGTLFLGLGGHLMQTPADAALFFQRPSGILLPFLLAYTVCYQFGLRLLVAASLTLKHGLPKRRTLLDPMFSFFHDTEVLGGLIAVALWSAWGWATVPYSLLINEALLLSARAYFERLDARREAEHDPLTGLASWRGLENDLRRRMETGRWGRRPFALIFLDVDGLKRVNDTLGHAAGDDLLRLVGETCRLHARARDLVGRRSGDEFLLILDGLDRASADRVMRRVQEAVTDALAVHPQFAGAVGASVGLAVYPADAMDAPLLIEIADRQMYQDKRARKEPHEERVVGQAA